MSVIGSAFDARERFASIKLLREFGNLQANGVQIAIHPICRVRIVHQQKVGRDLRARRLDASHSMKASFDLLRAPSDRARPSTKLRLWQK